MEDLKKMFGVNIASFVDFRPEDVDENNEGNKEYLSLSSRDKRYQVVDLSVKNKVSPMLIKCLKSSTAKESIIGSQGKISFVPPHQKQICVKA